MGYWKIHPIKGSSSNQIDRIHQNEYAKIDHSKLEKGINTEKEVKKN